MLALTAGGVAVWGAACFGSLLASTQPQFWSVIVTVTDRQGNPVGGLGTDDFVVREDGTRREVLSVRAAAEPIDVVLLLDTSQAMAPHFQDLRRAVPPFVRTIARHNPVTIMTFGERPVVVAPSTQDTVALDRAVGRLFPFEGSGAYLLEAVLEACRGIEKREPDRAVVLVVSFGGVEFSTLHHQRVTEALARARAALWALVINPTAERNESEETRQRNLLLDVGPRASGGIRADLLTSMALGDQLTRMAALLASQYRVEYARPDTLIPPDRTEVTLARPGLEAHATPPQRKRP